MLIASIILGVLFGLPDSVFLLLSVLFGCLMSVVEVFLHSLLLWL